MGLSGREVLLILRARDEASRTIGRVSSAMHRMDRDAAISSRSGIRENERNLLAMRRQVHDVEFAYRDATLSARKLYMAGNIDGKQYRQMMYDAQRLRVDQQEQLRQLRQGTEDVIRAENDRINQLAAERDALRHRGQMLMANGAAAIGAGTAMVYFGARGLAAWKTNVDAAISYEQQARKTLTQVDNNAVGLQRISKMGKQIADTVPVAFEEIQPALYDIFSSIDVGTRGARKLLKQFAKDAVGGQTEMKVATRANLAIMNAYKVGVKGAAKVSDFMFQLVRKGVGSYDEFAKSIGRAIPSARRAGQSYQTLGAMMAFLTRNGLSAAMAATSSARALDALTHPKTVSKLKEIGINVRDAKGEFRPLVDILGDMNKEFGHMTAPKRAKALYELFKSSGGTIQARRFFDTYFKNVKEFNQRTREMSHTAGAASDAFKKMADSPQAKLQALKNDWTLLRIELGENLLPAALKIVGVFSSAINWFRQLDDRTKRNVTLIAALTSAIILLTGMLTVGAGAVAVYAGAIQAMGWSAVRTTARMAGLAGGLSLLAAGFYKTKDATKTADAELGIMMSTIGGALVGGSVGGPIGALIGAAGGAAAAIWHLKQNSGKLKDEWEGGKKVILDYASTLNKATGAATRLTRATVLQGLEASGVAGGARTLGVTMRDLIDATLGDAEAYRRVTHAAKGHMSILDAMTSSKVNKWIQDQSLQFRKQSAEINHTHDNLRTWFQDLKGIRHIKQINTKLNLIDYKPTRKQMAELIKQYKLTPKELKIIYRAIGYNPMKRQINDVKKNLKDTNKTPGGAKKWRDDLLKSLTQGEMDTSHKVKGINKTLTEGTSKAKPNLQPFSLDMIAQLARIRSNASRGGAGIGSALKSGTLAGVSGLSAALSGEVAAAVNNAIAAGKHAAQAHSPSRKMIKLAKDLADGLIVGWKKYKPSAGFMQIDKMIKADRHHHHGGRDGHKHRHWTKMMKDVWKTLLKDMKTELPKMKKLLDLVEHMIDKKFKKMNKKQKAAMLEAFRKSIEDEMRRLDRVARHYQKVVKKLEKAQEKLKRLKEARRDYLRSVRDSIKDYGSLGSLTQPEDVFGNQEDWTVGNITAQLQQRLATIKEFGRNLKKLLQMGFSKAVYDQVVQMGPEAGAIFAAALIQATPEEVSQINTLSSQITNQANSIATTAANQMYNAGIAAAQAIVDGLKEKEKDLRAIAEHLGKMIARAIKRALRGQDLTAAGSDHGKTLAAGMLSSRDAVAAAAAELSKAAMINTYASSTPVVGVGGSTGTGTYSTGGRPVVQQQITVNTQEINPRLHAAQLGWELAARGGR